MGARRSVEVRAVGVRGVGVRAVRVRALGGGNRDVFKPACQPHS